LLEKMFAKVKAEGRAGSMAAEFNSIVFNKMDNARAQSLWKHVWYALEHSLEVLDGSQIYKSTSKIKGGPAVTSGILSNLGIDGKPVSFGDHVGDRGIGYL
jgi:hypothetical protein